MSGFVPADSSIAALLKVRIVDGVIVSRFDLAPGGIGHTLGDVAVAANGDVFTSDSREPVLYRLRKGKTVLEAYRDPLFRSLQGIALTRDTEHVYVADYSHGLLRLDLATGTRITRQETIDRNLAVADEPTIGVIVGRSYLYIANSQWDKHDDFGVRVAGSVLSPALLLAVPLPH